jgi:Arm DNA-binding domain
MLNDKFIKQLKSKGKIYKVADRDGLYVHVAISGTVTFRYDYRINRRRETLVIGKYGRGGIPILRETGSHPVSINLSVSITHCDARDFIRNV